MRAASTRIRRFVVATGAILLFALLAADTYAQRKRWWLDPAVQQELQLTEAQVQEIDREFRRDLEERREVHRAVNRAEAAFRSALAAGDDAKATELIPEMVELRAKQNTFRTRVLLRMSWAMTPEQRTRLRALVPRSGIQ